MATDCVADLTFDSYKDMINVDVFQSHGGGDVINFVARGRGWQTLDIIHDCNFWYW